MLTLPRSSLRPFEDPAWFSKCVRQGLMLLVPFVGYVALLAWQRRVFESARSEGPLPDSSLDTRGAGPTVAALALLVASREHRRDRFGASRVCRDGAHQVARWQACVEARAKAAAGPYR